jgi:hypothetical protein
VCAVVRGVATVDLKLTLEKTVQLKNVQHVFSIRKKLISGSFVEMARKLCSSRINVYFPSMHIELCG